MEETASSSTGTVKSITSVMIRDLDGSIAEWNKASERHYGWSRRQAVGHVSHQLLNTVFPYPLSQINSELMSKGVWEGFLIHTLSDGRRVKVQSRWELTKEEQSGTPAVKVIERNSVLEPVGPENSHLVTPLTPGARIRELLWREKSWWLGPFLFVLGTCAILLRLADEVPLVPLRE